MNNDKNNIINLRFLYSIFFKTSILKLNLKVEFF